MTPNRAKLAIVASVKVTAIRVLDHSQRRLTLSMRLFQRGTCNITAAVLNKVILVKANMDDPMIGDFTALMAAIRGVPNIMDSRRYTPYARP